MKARHLILMLLKASGGKIDSKTKLQKEIYFISLLLKKEIKFKAHYYGPYSLEVEDGLDELIGAGFIDIQRDVFGFKQGFEVKRYDFSLTESGQKFEETLSEKNPYEKNTVQEFVKKLEEIGTPDYRSLSIAAKVYFILDKKSVSLTKDKIRDKAMEFGWDVSESDINNAEGILEKLDFINEG